MARSISIFILVPIALTILQLLLVLFATYFILLKTRLCSKPIENTYENQGILSAALVLGVLIIASADITDIFQTYKVYKQYSPQYNHDLFQQFSQFFFVILAICLFHIIFILSLLRLFAGPINNSHLPNVGVPFIILIASIAIGTAISEWFIAKEICDIITPQTFNFR